MDWFLYDRDFRHEKFELYVQSSRASQLPYLAVEEDGEMWVDIFHLLYQISSSFFIAE